MSRALKIADTLSLPIDAVTETFGILAARGAGKSNLAAVMAEGMADAGLPFVVVDPVGSWYGLRAGADGSKNGGLPIPIFGGKHGDVPLERHGGELLADLVTSKRLSCVLDLSTFDAEAAKKAFLLDFARRLYLKNEDPLHLFLEEADDYIPQRPMRDEAQLLRAWENIVRRGRARGLGMTLITQRSASLNKSVLTQVQTLFVLRTTGPQDRAAIEAWVKYHDTDETLLASLSGLGPGEGWVWSPHFLQRMSRHQFRRRRTFDSGATPKNLRGKDARPAATLADVDLGAIQTEMAATVERAKQDDPKALKQKVAEQERRIKALEAQVDRAKASRSSSSNEKEKQEVAILTDADRAKLAELVDVLKAVRADFAKSRGDVENGIASRLRGMLENFTTDVAREAERKAALISDRLERAGFQRIIDKLGQAQHPPAPRQTLTTTKGSSAGFTGAAREPRRTPADGPADSSLSSGGQIDQDLGTGAAARILAVIKQYPGAPANQIGALAGVSPRLSTWRVAIARLRQAGLIEGDRAGFRLTPLGEAAAASVPDAPTGAQAIDHWRQELGDGAPRLIFDALVEAHPRALSAMEVHERTGVDPSKSTYRVAIAALRHRQLVEGNRDGMRAASALFT